MPMTSIKRRFEFAEGASNKFWEVVVERSRVTVHYGRIGTSGQTETKSFPDSAAAQKHADKKIQEKVNKGYVEIGNP
jgi:predicted DNA-binding WGR domain protein